MKCDPESSIMRKKNSMSLIDQVHKSNLAIFEGCHAHVKMDPKNY